MQRLGHNQSLGIVTPVHNRLSDEFRQTIGLFMELCPLQLRFERNETFESLFKRMKRESRQTMTHYQYGSALTLPSETFDAMFNMHEAPEFSLNGMKVTFCKYHTGHGSESLSCHVFDHGEAGSFELFFEFHDDVFTAVQRQEAVESYLAFLDAVLLDSAAPLEFEFLPPAEPVVSQNGALPEMAVANGDPTSAFVAPRDAMEIQMARLWEELLPIERVGAHDNFFELGGSSFLATKLFLRVQEVMGQELPLSTLLEAKTVAGMVQVLREKSAGRLWSQTVTMKPGRAGVDTLFFVPGAGGSLIRLDTLMGLLDDSLPVVAFQLPGLDGAQEPFESITAGARYFIEVMQALQPAGPYQLCGYSWGGMVAFEMAQQLVQAGHEVQFLGLIDTPAQHPNYAILKTAVFKSANWLGWSEPRCDSAFLAIRDKLYRLEYFSRKGVQVLQEKGPGHVMVAGARKFKGVGYKLAQKVSLRFTAPSGTDGAPQDGDQPAGDDQAGDFWSRFNLDAQRLKFVRANDRAIRLHVPQSYPGKAFLFRSSKGYRNPLNRSAAPQLGWTAVIKEGLKSSMIPGDHLGMLVEPNVKLLAAKLQAAMDLKTEL